MKRIINFTNTIENFSISGKITGSFLNFFEDSDKKNLGCVKKSGKCGLFLHPGLQK